MFPGILSNSEAPHVPDGCATASPSHLASRRSRGGAYPNSFVDRLPCFRARHADRARNVVVQKSFFENRMAENLISESSAEDCLPTI